jgi:release factor glutamine methyltransferase
MSAIRDVERRLAEAGIASAAIEAQILVARALGIGRAAALASDEPLTEGQRAGVESLLSRRLEREPLAYLTGTAEFFSIPLSVGPGVHLPRPSTETLVEEALRRLPPRPAIVADVGTGSGNVAAAIERHRPAARVFAIDIDPRALSYARRNLRNARILEGDLLAPLLELGMGRELDLVLCNPPYIARDEWDLVDPEVRHEPRVALDGGRDGLDAVRRLAAQAPAVLKPGGSLLCEVGFRQADFAARLLPSSRYMDVAVVPDSEGIPRVVAAVIR